MYTLLLNYYVTRLVQMIQSDGKSVLGRDGQHGIYVQVPSGAKYLEVVGSLLFGGGQQLEAAVAQLCQPPSPKTTNGTTTPQRKRKVHAVILDLSHLTACDVSGLQVLEQMHGLLKKAGVELVVVTPREQPFQTMTKAGFFTHVGKANTHRTLTAALIRAKSIITAATTADKAAAVSFKEGTSSVVAGEKDIIDASASVAVVNAVVPVAGSSVKSSQVSRLY